MRANFIGRGASAHTKYCSSKNKSGPAEAAEAMFEVSGRRKRIKSESERQEATMIDRSDVVCFDSSYELIDT